MSPLSVSLLALCLALAHARHFHLPEDTYAFPKYRVAFLDNLPLRNHTAQTWLRDGLRGGEREFLDQHWKEDDWNMPPSPKEIGSGDRNEASSSSHALEFMKMPEHSYLCLIPPPPSLSSPMEDEPDNDVTPVRSWSLLQPLAGTCLYHRQGWFTYSYCHNEQIRQFKELPHSHPHPPGGHQPKEDPDYPSYTLGRAPATPERGADLTLAERSALATNLELAREAGSRYLVQRWGDGSICDKTGRSREVEVQFHCSMTMTDTILFVKEAKTCSYVLVIHTPRLCSEPGFKSPLDSREEVTIRCREIVDSDADLHLDQPHLTESDQPYHLPRRKPPLPIGALIQQDSAESEQTTGDAINVMIKRAVEAYLDNKGKKLPEGEYPQVITDQFAEDGIFLIDIPIDDLDEAALANALRAAGIEIQTVKTANSKEEDDSDEAPHDHDEL